MSETVAASVSSKSQNAENWGSEGAVLGMDDSEPLDVLDGGVDECGPEVPLGSVFVVALVAVCTLLVPLLNVGAKVGIAPVELPLLPSDSPEREFPDADAFVLLSDGAEIVVLSATELFVDAVSLDTSVGGED
jgi:hypothetical protein